MKTSVFLAFALAFLISTAFSASQDAKEFVACLSRQNIPIRNTVFTKRSPWYSSILYSAVASLQFTSPETPKPQAIFRPLLESHLAAAIRCSKKTGLEIRLRCGGHDFEGQSIIADVPFVVVDLLYLRDIDLDVENGTVWIQGGATQGELYYQLATHSKTLAFPGGEFGSVGIGGFISGGGYGMLQRKFGLAADHVIDARIMNANGYIHDRKSMGEDLFWAIRGGGGGAFGIVLSWKVKLVRVPSTISVFNIGKTIEEGVTPIFYKFQHVADRLPEDLFIRAYGNTMESPQTGNTTIQILFQCLYLGGVDELLSLMNEHLPELGVVREDCKEMSWIESVLYFHGLSSIDALLNRDHPPGLSFKEKTDYSEEPIPLEALGELWKLYIEAGPNGAGGFLFSPGGGKMSEISESSIPYPFRAGYKFLIYQSVAWNTSQAELEPLKLIRKIYDYMTPYVVNNPRAAYANYRDLDLGVTTKYTAPEDARSWGLVYFRNNYDRLVKVKTRVDPHNFFRNQQSIPPATLCTSATTEMKSDASGHMEQ